MIRVNRRITFTSKAKFSVAPRLMISTRFPCYAPRRIRSRNRSSPRRSGHAWQYRTVEAGEGEGECLAQGESVRSSQYAPVTGSTGSLINFSGRYTYFSGHFLFCSAMRRFCTQQLPAFPQQVSQFAQFRRFPSFPSSPAGGRR